MGDVYDLMHDVIDVIVEVGDLLHEVGDLNDQVGNVVGNFVDVTVEVGDVIDGVRDVMREVDEAIVGVADVGDEVGDVELGVWIRPGGVCPDESAAAAFRALARPSHFSLLLQRKVTKRKQPPRRIYSSRSGSTRGFPHSASCLGWKRRASCAPPFGSFEVAQLSLS